MRAVLLPGDRECVVADIERPTAGLGQVIIEVKAAGLCGSDLHQQYRVPASERRGVVVGHRTSPDIVTGHEPAGIIVEAGPGVPPERVGSRVAVAHVSGCGNCVECRRGHDINCPRKHFYGLDRAGAMSDYMLAESRDCVELPDSITFEDAAFWACGAGTGYYALRRGDQKIGETVLVMGLGPVGVSAVRFGAVAGAHVIAADPVPERVEFAKRFGAHSAIDPSAVDVETVTRELTGGLGADLVIEASGTRAGRNAAIRAAKIGGRVVFIGLNAQTIDFSVDLAIMRQLTLIGSWVFGTPDLQDMLQVAERLGISLAPMILERYSLEEAAEAFREFDQGSIGKTVFTWA